jgi:hypothetical protein
LFYILLCFVNNDVTLHGVHSGRQDTLITLWENYNDVVIIALTSLKFYTLPKQNLKAILIIATTILRYILKHTL